MDKANDLKKSVRGFSSLTLLVVLSIGASMVIYIHKQYLAHQNTYMNNAVVKYVDSLMVVLASYYKTECYTNNGVVADSVTLDDLNSAGYINSNYLPKKGTITLLIDDSSTYAKLLIQITFDSAKDARNVFNIGSSYSPILLGEQVTWKTTASSINRVNSDVDMLLYASGNCN